MNEHNEIIVSESTNTELARTMAEGDPETMLSVLEKKASLAPRMRQAIETLMISQTYPEDWTIQGEGDRAKACLGSSGAERIGRNFPIRYRDVSWKREDFADSSGKGYRYVYSGYAEMYDRTIYAEGSYSTRDEFLGKTHGQWRAVEDINEGDIRSAAHHIFMGNAIKQLLGLRGMPVSAFDNVMGRTQQEASKAGSVYHKAGAQGGTARASSSMAMSEHITKALRALRPGNAAAQADLYHEVADFDGGKGRVVAKAPDKLSEKWAGKVIGALDKMLAEQGISLDSEEAKNSPESDTNNNPSKSDDFPF